MNVRLPLRDTDKSLHLWGRKSRRETTRDLVKHPITEMLFNKCFPVLGNLARTCLWHTRRTGQWMWWAGTRDIQTGSYFASASVNPDQTVSNGHFRNYQSCHIKTRTMTHSVNDNRWKLFSIWLCKGGMRSGGTTCINYHMLILP